MMSTDPPGAKKRVLIVEDDMVQRLVLENMLRRLDLEIAGKVSNGQSAIRKALELKPDLITMDIFLKDKTDGVTAVEKIHEQLTIPVIYITGNSDKFNSERLQNTEFIGYVNKPVTFQKLKSVLEGTIFLNGGDSTQNGSDSVQNGVHPKKTGTENI